jgi:hypothetical protein
MVDAERVILRTKHPVYTWWFYVLCTSWTSSKTRHSGSLPSIPRNAPAWPSIFYLPIDQLVPRCYPAGSQDFDGFWGIIRMNCASCGKQVYNFSCHTPCGWWITSFQTWSFFASGTTHIFIWWVVDLPLWKILKSVGIIIPNIWKNTTCSKPPTSSGFYRRNLCYGNCPPDRYLGFASPMTTVAPVTTKPTSQIKACRSWVGSRSQTAQVFHMF